MFTEGTRTPRRHIEERPEMLPTGYLVCRTVHHDNGFISYVLSAVMGARNTVCHFYHAYTLRDYSIYLLYTVSPATTAGGQPKGVVVYDSSTSEKKKRIFRYLRCSFSWAHWVQLFTGLLSQPFELLASENDGTAKRKNEDSIVYGGKGKI